MSRTPLTLAEANSHLRALLGLPIALAWKGHGSAIFLELGRLTPSKHPRGQDSGEACIAVEWDWRVEEGRTVKFGSSSSRPNIKTGIEGLRGAAIESISINGQVPELTLHFSNAQRLMSAVMTTGDPQWYIKLPDARWLFCASGTIFVGDGSGAQTTSEEAAAITHARNTADRWGTPLAHPISGRCGACKWFIALDGDFSLLDFGACTASTSPLDGQVVNVSSGCDVFAQEA